MNRNASNDSPNGFRTNRPPIRPPMLPPDHKSVAAALQQQGDKLSPRQRLLLTLHYYYAFNLSRHLPNTGSVSIPTTATGVSGSLDRMVTVRKITSRRRIGYKQSQANSKRSAFFGLVLLTCVMTIFTFLEIQATQHAKQSGLGGRRGIGFVNQRRMRASNALTDITLLQLKQKRQSGNGGDLYWKRSRAIVVRRERASQHNKLMHALVSSVYGEAVNFSSTVLYNASQGLAKNSTKFGHRANEDREQWQRIEKGKGKKVQCVFRYQKPVHWNLTDDEIAQVLKDLHSTVRPGGVWLPTDCIPKLKIAVIIPFRDRMSHLNHLLAVLHQVLQEQRVAYRIIVSEQYGTDTFNKIPVEQRSLSTPANGFDCFVFHDVDLVPERTDNYYGCTTDGGDLPKHLSVAINEHGYTLLYDNLVGGVLSLNRNTVFKLNGYSNMYYGWGAEDDDLAARMKATNLRIQRPPASVGRFSMLKHVKRKPSETNIRWGFLVRAPLRFKVDGINSVKYRLIQRTIQPLYTHFYIDIGPIPSWVQEPH